MLQNADKRLISVHLYKGILFSLKQEGDSDTGSNVDELRGHSAKGGKPVTKGQVLCGSTYRMSLEQSDS